MKKKREDTRFFYSASRWKPFMLFYWFSIGIISLEPILFDGPNQGGLNYNVYHSLAF